LQNINQVGRELLYKNLLFGQERKGKAQEEGGLEFLRTPTPD